MMILEYVLEIPAFIFFTHLSQFFGQLPDSHVPTINVLTYDFSIYGFSK